jgi:hypothetical protein
MVGVGVGKSPFLVNLSWGGGGLTGLGAFGAGFVSGALVGTGVF